MGQRYTLFFTAREGREDDLRWALHDRKISPDLRDPDTKQTALHLAAAKGRVGCVKLLVDAGKCFQENPQVTISPPLVSRVVIHFIILIHCHANR